MDYRKQQAYLKGSRIRGAVAALIVLSIAILCLWLSVVTGGRVLSGFALVALALAGSLYYTPDYLHLTVAPEKSQRWQVKIRWRIAAAVLVLGLALSSSNADRGLSLIAAAWLAFSTFGIKKFAPLRFYAALFWFTDFILLIAVMLGGWISLLLGSVFLAAAAHLALVAVPPSRLFTVRVLAIGVILVAFAPAVPKPHLAFVVACGTLVAAACLLTAWLVNAAEKRNRESITAAMSELVEFTGYPPERIRQLWETSNQQLAANWKQAAIPQDDRERMAEWYRQNSELYLFAISAYNLEYKRIKSNLKVIRFARGSCLDYGAGNGEILLELARRGHPVTYFDVEGVTMRFAQKRSQQHGLNIEFARTKDDLRAAAQKHGFDTIFSFDVLEHLPDLPGELTFLSSLLSPGGVFVFDVPAGSTKAHPMHLNHNLNVLEFLSAKGLKDRRTLSLRMPFRKEEKYVFEA
jgi:2-polyprenyl-3-methyl-5-hydroxy-6-metoxy-1,4-benzoquinol methylase